MGSLLSHGSSQGAMRTGRAEFALFDGKWMPLLSLHLYMYAMTMVRVEMAMTTVRVTMSQHEYQ